ncbi:MAG: sulfotransferase [Cyanobacteria bacterium P01_F01_bin.86]
MTLPDFLIVGAMKAGTTWLSCNLGNHPQVFMPNKEIHFFNNPKNFERGFQWYENKFAKAGDAIAVGEKTAGYLLQPETPKVLAESLPDAKIIIVLRDPVKRAISQINHHVRYGDIPTTLDPNNLIDSDAFSKIDKEFAILQRGRYLEQIERYYDTFDPDRILIFINEIDIRKTPEKTLARTCEFLGVDSNFEFPLREKKIHENRNSKLGTLLAYKFFMLRPVIAKVDRFIPGAKLPPFKLSNSESKKLHKIYQEDNQRLFEFLDREMPEAWLGN